jgi:hypothetical protein
VSEEYALPFRESQLPHDRRANDGPVMLLLQSLHDKQDRMEERLTTHMANETGELAVEVARLMAQAFPDGDPDGHRRHHEAVIAKAEARAEFWRKMAYEITKYGLLGFIGWLGVTTWQAFLQGPHK